jgi:hypothetical protein
MSKANIEFRISADTKDYLKKIGKIRRQLRWMMFKDKIKSFLSMK